MKIDKDTFERYVNHMKRVDPKYNQMDAILIDGYVKWVRVKSIKEQIIKKEKFKKEKKRKLSLTIKDEIIKRDGYRCAECGCMINLEVHHIEYRSDGGTDCPENLITLCTYCHYEQHKGEPICNLMLSNLKHKGLL